MLDELRHGRFILEDEEDEIRTLKVMNNMRKYETSSLGLTIAPTLACNFRCIYCYEGELRPLVMDDLVQQAILDFVSTRIKTLQRLGITWYGGEPLLATEVIYNLSEKLIKLCADHDCKYDASLITNGWLLSRETAERLQECQVTMIQVTLDGPPDVHNARRPLKDGSGTFHRIVENIAAVTDLFHIVTRINVDTTNLDRVIELFEFLHERQLADKINPYLGKVTADTKACADFQTWCYDTSSFAQVEIKLRKELEARGIPIHTLYPQFLTNFCSATKLHSYVLDPLGRLYKCWNVIENEKEIVGNITEHVELNHRLSKWLAINPFDIPECRECDILPLCAGGCPYYYCRGEYEKTGRPSCVSWRYHLDDALLLYYQAWKENPTAQQ